MVLQELLLEFSLRVEHMIKHGVNHRLGLLSDLLSLDLLDLGLGLLGLLWIRLVRPGIDWSGEGAGGLDEDSSSVAF